MAPLLLELPRTGYLRISWGDELPFPSLLSIFHDTFLAQLLSEPGSGKSLCFISSVPCTGESVDLVARIRPALDPCSAAQGGVQSWVVFLHPCALTPRFSLLQGKEMLTQKLPLWQQSCSDPNKIPDRAIQLMQQMAASSNGTIMPSPLSTSKSNLIISDPIPGAKPLPVPPELAPFVGVSISVLEIVLPF